MVPLVLVAVVDRVSLQTLCLDQASLVLDQLVLMPVAAAEAQELMPSVDRVKLLI